MDLLDQIAARRLEVGEQRSRRVEREPERPVAARAVQRHREVELRRRGEDPADDAGAHRGGLGEQLGGAEATADHAAPHEPGLERPGRQPVELRLIGGIGQPVVDGAAVRELDRPAGAIGDRGRLGARQVEPHVEPAAAVAARAVDGVKPHVAERQPVELDQQVVAIDRQQPAEQRGRDVGAAVRAERHRRRREQAERGAERVGITGAEQLAVPRDRDQRGGPCPIALCVDEPEWQLQFGANIPHHVHVPPPDCDCRSARETDQLAAGRSSSGVVPGVRSQPSFCSSMCSIASSLALASKSATVSLDGHAL
jgi:hypothetical protein